MRSSYLFVVSNLLLILDSPVIALPTPLFPLQYCTQVLEPTLHEQHPMLRYETVGY
jgi:hypothetical protein